ncbi:hypothetical protein WH7805_13053 [Synechococcus sp. WH 7805]|nr:hypothetical protein WH7805_13053 [Synechococcus sp. WH 7805]
MVTKITSLSINSSDLRPFGFHKGNHNNQSVLSGLRRQRTATD